MIGSLKLSLLIGPVPMPAPRPVVEALSAVKVELGSGDTQSGFELTFDLAADSPLSLLFLITGGGGGVPFMRVVLVVTINGRAEPIVDGVATDVEMQPGDGGVEQARREGQGPVGADGHPGAAGDAVSRDAAVAARAGDPGEVRRLRRHARW